MPFPTVVTIYDGNEDENYLPPQWESNVRDSAWSFYRFGVRWLGLSKRVDEDLLVGYRRAPAMFYSLDNGESWTGPVDDANAPQYVYDPDDTASNAGDALIWNYDVRFGDDGGLAPEDVSAITVLIQTGTISEGADAGLFTFAYCDFDLEGMSWGAPYGEVIRDAHVLYPRGYSSQPSLSPAGAVSPTPVFWWTNHDDLAQEIEGTSEIRGAGGYGVANGVVGEDGTFYTIPDTHEIFTAGEETPPDAGFPYTSNLRIVGSNLAIASAAGGENLQIWHAIAEPFYTGSWAATSIDSGSFGKNPWVIFSEGALHCYWCGPGSSGVYRVVNQGGASWSSPELVSDVEEIFLGPNVCNNPVLGGVDVTLVLGLFKVVTFHLPSVGGGGGDIAARYYGM